jgi:hypothetical protein
MKRTEALFKVFSAVSEGRPLDDAGKANAERMVSHGWLTRDRSGIYSPTRTGKKAFAAFLAPPDDGEQG